MNEKLNSLLASAPEVEPDETDLAMLAEMKQSAGTYVRKEEYEKVRESRTFNGNISLRIPKTLHQDLVKAAKEEGVSLNQYCLYKLAQ